MGKSKNQLSVSAIKELPKATHGLLRRSGFKTIGALQAATDEQIADAIRGEENVIMPMLIVNDVRECLNRFLANPEQSTENTEATQSEPEEPPLKPVIRYPNDSKTKLRKRLESTNAEIARLQQELPSYSGTEQAKVMSEDLDALLDQAREIEAELSA